MAKPNDGVSVSAQFEVRDLDFTPGECHQKQDSMNSKDKSNLQATTQTILETYSSRLVELLKDHQTLDEKLKVSREAREAAHESLADLEKRRLDNSEQIENLFIELSVKMWKGRLPATSIATVDARYSEITGRLLTDDLKEENWPAYFSAFQLSIDILNGMTLLL